MRVVKADFRRGILITERTASIENLRHVFRKHAVELWPETFEGGVTERIGAAKAVLVRNEEVEMFAVAIRAVGDEAVDGGQVVRLISQAVFVPLFDCDILYCRSLETLE